MRGMTHLGPAVLGQERFEEIQKSVKGGRDKYGPAVTGYTEPEPEPEAASPAHLSVRDLETVLGADARKMDYYLSAEWDREGGPRKSALRIFLRMEGEKESPRQVLIDRLTEALAE